MPPGMITLLMIVMPRGRLDVRRGLTGFGDVSGTAAQEERTAGEQGRQEFRQGTGFLWSHGFTPLGQNQRVDERGQSLPTDHIQQPIPAEDKSVIPRICNLFSQSADLAISAEAAGHFHNIGTSTWGVGRLNA